MSGVIAFAPSHCDPRTLRTLGVPYELNGVFALAPAQTTSKILRWGCCVCPFALPARGREETTLDPGANLGKKHSPAQPARANQKQQGRTPRSPYNYLSGFLRCPLRAPLFLCTCFLRMFLARVFSSQRGEQHDQLPIEVHTAEMRQGDLILEIVEMKASKTSAPE